MPGFGLGEGADTDVAQGGAKTGMAAARPGYVWRNAVAGVPINGAGIHF